MFTIPEKHILIYRIYVGSDEAKATQVKTALDAQLTEAKDAGHIERATGEHVVEPIQESWAV